MKIKANKNLTRKKAYDAGIDIPLESPLMLRPGVVYPVTIPTGLSVEIPKGFMGMLIPRTSAARRGIHIAASPIDSGYTGIIHMIITYTGTHIELINEGESIAQLVILPCILAELVTEIENDDRGAGAFGSTGK